jgi:hypothetical protein
VTTLKALSAEEAADRLAIRELMVDWTEASPSSP